MARFKTVSAAALAWQVAEIVQFSADWDNCPEPVKNAYETSQTSPLPWQIHANTEVTPDAIYIPTAHGIVRAEADHWIVLESTGEWSVYTPELFEASFKAVK
jgi:hypothetical protein